MSARKYLFLLCLAAMSCAETAGDEVDADPPEDIPDLEVIEWLDTGDWKKDDVADASQDDASKDDAADDDVADAPNDVSLMTRDAPIDAPRDVSMDVARDVVMDVPRDVPRDVVTDAPRDVPTDTGGFSFPTPIRHVIVLVRENRTFDHMFSGFPGAETTTFGVRSDGSHVTLRVAPNGDLAGDIRHSHNGALMAFAGGGMNGFDRNAMLHSDTGNPLGAFIHYTEAQIPAYWQYARRYVLCDHFFSTTLTQSSPGHFAFWTAQTPFINNPECTGASCARGGGCLSTGSTVTAINQDTCAQRATPVAACFDVPTVVDRFPAMLNWRVYASANDHGIVSSPLALARGITRDRAEFLSHTAPTSDLLGDLAAGRQPNLVVAHVGGAAGEHPPHGLCAGESYAVQIVNAVMRGPHWRDTAILLTYDDWGGFYDHVRPPQERCANGDHVHLGFRLPLIVISPYTRRSNDPAHPWVFHGVTEQSSVPRMIEDIFRLPRMSARDAHARDGRAGSLMGVFDFAHPDFSTMVLTPRRCP